MFSIVISDEIIIKKSRDTILWVGSRTSSYSTSPRNPMSRTISAPKKGAWGFKTRATSPAFYATAETVTPTAHNEHEREITTTRQRCKTTMIQIARGTREGFKSECFRRRFPPSHLKRDELLRVCVHAKSCPQRIDRKNSYHRWILLSHKFHFFRAASQRTASNIEFQFHCLRSRISSEIFCVASRCHKLFKSCRRRRRRRRLWTLSTARMMDTVRFRETKVCLLWELALWKVKGAIPNVPFVSSEQAAWFSEHSWESLSHASEEE